MSSAKVASLRHRSRWLLLLSWLPTSQCIKQQTSSCCNANNVLSVQNVSYGNYSLRRNCWSQTQRTASRAEPECCDARQQCNTREQL